MGEENAMNRKILTEALGVFGLVLMTASTAAAQAPVDYTSTSHYIVSGAIGGAMGGDAEDGSFGFDGAFDYLRNGRHGFEFLGSFTPDLSLDEFDTLQEHHVNSYMFNGISALPLGLGERWMPFASGGVGIMTLRSELDLDDDFETVGLPLVDDNQFGANVGFGVMGFMNQVGLRADVRYFTGIGNADDVDDPTGSTLNSVVDNVNFWRTTVGLSYRW
jgi:hypothetical protein